MTRTIRAWRGYGLSGGMIHWSDAYAWKNNRDAESTYAFPPFEPGQRGAYVRRLMKREVFPRLPEVANLTATGEALRDNYEPTLSWIAGPPDAFTRQDHIFTGGEKILKSAALLNDSPKPQPYSLEWTAEVAGANVAGGKLDGEVPVGVPAFAAFEFAAPSVKAKSDGIIRLKTKIGDKVDEDTFAFRVLPAPAPLVLKSPVFLLDPEGITSKWLQSLGVSSAPFPSKPSPGVLVVGRNAIVKTPPAEWPALRTRIEEFLKGGGRVLVMAQDPAWIREMSGLRKAAGRGVVIAFALAPNQLPAKDKTYFRFSQWRLTRALSQILTNLGGTFQSVCLVCKKHPTPPRTFYFPSSALFWPSASILRGIKSSESGAATLSSARAAKAP